MLLYSFSGLELGEEQGTYEHISPCINSSLNSSLESREKNKEDV